MDIHGATQFSDTDPIFHLASDLPESKNRSHRFRVEVHSFHPISNTSSHFPDLTRIKLPTRPLGRDDPLVPALGLGLMGLSSLYGVPPSDEERFEFLERAYELGCTHWDSAALYGDSEELLGKWFQRTGKRKEGECWKNIELVGKLNDIAGSKGCTSGRLTLGWLVKQSQNIIPIPGTKKIKYLEENVGACAVTLTGEEDRVIGEAIKNTEVYGTRVAENLMGAFVIDTPPLLKGP
ncbi:NADP-dependent oxidoreductase domain-containing protein [Xylariomycetidae sp. FL2044]|nr:NADP-dependent oxidoreductase domain-containing protein [Xylariomycetidae sp. FL2044]